jgi:hypothetical protein
LITLLMLLGFFLFLASLAAFHGFLILTNQTTYEMARCGSSAQLPQSQPCPPRPPPPWVVAVAQRWLASLLTHHKLLTAAGCPACLVRRFSRSKGPLGSLTSGYRSGARRSYNKGCIRNLWLFLVDSDDFYYTTGNGEDCLMDHPVCTNQCYSCC